MQLEQHIPPHVLDRLACQRKPEAELPLVLLGLAERMRRTAAIALAIALAACDDPGSPTGPHAAGRDDGDRSYRLRRRDGAAWRPSGLGGDLREWCRRHPHPSELAKFCRHRSTGGSVRWYELTFTDVPLNLRVSFRVNDQNACDENPTGAVTRNVKCSRA
jgi:hypothetical protein